MDEAAALARSSRAAMIAAAGCGKTQVIATAVAEHGGARELVLTHTHAGVDAIRRRLSSFTVPASAYRIDTIAGWALRLATAFPRTSAIPSERPRSNSEYSAVYTAATQLLALRPIQEIMRASYSGVYVDEYQDCTVQQHELVLAILPVLPCRIVGDPLQGIFDFGDNEPIQWNEHVRPSFEELSGPTTPWRWAATNPPLGEWLQEVRVRLEHGEQIDLQKAPVRWIDGTNAASRPRKQRDACFHAANNDEETVIAIHQWPSQCYNTASRLNGSYSCIEAIDTKDLYDFARSLDETQGHSRAVALLDFAAKCVTKVRTELKTIRDALNIDRVPNVRKHRNCLEAVLRVAGNDSMAEVESALQVISRMPGAIVYRRELIREMVRSVRTLLSEEASTLADAAWIVRNRARYRGRVLSRCAVGTTLLIKGLEFDHAVVLNADDYDVRNLYVALTRGSRSLTIISNSPNLKPKGLHSPGDK